MAPFVLDDGDRPRRKSPLSFPANDVGVTWDNSIHLPDKRFETSQPKAASAETEAEHGNAADDADDDRADEISVALEWKLLLPLLARGAHDPQPNDRRPVVEAQDENDEPACLVQAHECVAQTIRAAGEHAVTAQTIAKDGLQEKDFWDGSWIVKKANSAEPMADERRRMGYVWVPVEICSPKMGLKDPATRVRMEGVLNLLCSGHRLAANCTCEVHVHLGRMDGRPWSLATLKRLASLLWVAEPTLRSIRDPKSPNFDNVYTWGFEMRRHSRLAKRVADHVAQSACWFTTTAGCQSFEIPDKEVRGALQDQTSVLSTDLAAFRGIWKTTSHVELGRLLSGPEKKYRRLGFNFSAFGQEDQRSRANPRTVEFRIMDGSVQTELILGWLTICGAIAEAAVIGSDGRFAAALGRLLREADWPRNAGTTESEETQAAGARRGRGFRELMEVFGVPEKDYRGLEEKIKREHG